MSNLRGRAATLLIAAGAFATFTFAHAVQAQAGASSTLVVRSDRAGPVISRHIFGQFAEHLGEGIYGGLWVGPNSPIPNVRGIRSDVVEALRAIKVPNVRWPGGCFADRYNWRNGIGPADQRVATVNFNWGSTLEPNTFGTHEFMDFVEQIGSEAYITINVGSGTPADAAEWLEYMTTDLPSTLGKLRESNGRKAPYRVKFLGLGNEAWGCGGGISAEAYVEKMTTFSTFVRNLNPAQSGNIKWVRGPDPMVRIAAGPDGPDTEFTEAVMRSLRTSAPHRWGIEGLSLHQYTQGSRPLRSPATRFTESEYLTFLQQTLRMDELIRSHSAIMDKYDPEKKVALVVDEWGVWLQPMVGTNPMFLKQQNSLRDAIVASLHLNIFARHADRVRMANIAQMVNVLQAMILTDSEKMLLTPTYHVFRMYVPFQDAQLIPIELAAGNYTYGNVTVPKVDAIAARSKDGNVWLALTNVDPNQPADLTATAPGVAVKSATGEVLTASAIDSVNTFAAPGTVSPKPLRVSAQRERLVLRLPPKSVTVLRLYQ